MGFPFRSNFKIEIFACANNNDKNCSCARACVHACMSNTPLTHTWKVLHAHNPVSSRKHGKEALGIHGWSGTAPSSLIPPAKCKHMMAKGRQLPAFVWLAPMQCKLLSLWGAKCVCMRHGDTYNCCVGILSALSLSSPSSPSLSDLLLPDATISCSFYFSSWIPFILSFTFVDGIFPEVKERKLCPCLWEKEKDSPNLTPRAYSLEQHFLLEHCEGTTEFVSDNTNTGKSTAELLFAITAYHQHFWLMQPQDQFIWCPRQSPRPRLQKTFSDSTRLHKSEPQGTNPSYGCRVKSLWDLNEWG